MVDSQKPLCETLSVTKRLNISDVKGLAKRITDLVTGNPIMEKPLVDPDGSLPAIAPKRLAKSKSANKARPAKIIFLKGIATGKEPPRSPQEH